MEDPDELAGLDKGLSLGGVVKRNRHTVEKDDRFTSRQDYVLGFDNAAKLELVAAQVEDLQQELAKAAELAQSREESHQGMTRQLEALRRVADDHRPWEQVSAAVAADELARIEQRLKDALAAQADLEPLRASIEAAGTTPVQHRGRGRAAERVQGPRCALTAADSLLDAARARLAQAPPSDATVAALEPYFAGFGDVLEMHELDNLANQVRTRLLAELHAAESRGQATVGAPHPDLRGLRPRVGHGDLRGPRHLDRRRGGVRIPLPRDRQRRAARAGGRVPAVLQPAHARILQHPAAPAG